MRNRSIERDAVSFYAGNVAARKTSMSRGSQRAKRKLSESSFSFIQFARCTLETCLMLVNKLVLLSNFMRDLRESRTARTGSDGQNSREIPATDVFSDMCQCSLIISANRIRRACNIYYKHVWETSYKYRIMFRNKNNLLVSRQE